MPRRPNTAPLEPLGVAAVLLHSPNPDRLAAFYRDVIGLPLEPVEVSDFPPHHGCELGGVYLAIVKGKRTPGPSVGCVAFHVADVTASARTLEKAGVECVGAPVRSPLGLIARFLDPEGNLFELYEP